MLYMQSIDKEIYGVIFYYINFSIIQLHDHGPYPVEVCVRIDIRTSYIQI